MGKDLNSYNKEDGPIENRSCTDLICLCIFVLFIAATIGLYGYAVIEGDISQVGRPVDYSGNQCGFGTASGFPHLLFADLQAQDLINPIENTICVKACPKDYN